MTGRRTLASEVSTSGITLHAGVTARLVLRPAAAGTGIVFRRSDLPGTAPIPALWSHVAETRLGTVIRGDGGMQSGDVAVIEHLMAALAGACIDDCEIAVDAGEVPILDGDALSFSRLIDQAGTIVREGKTSALRVMKPVEVSAAGAEVRLEPADRASFFFEIDFTSRMIGQQRFDFVFSPEGFRRDIAPARTFGFLREAEQLRAAGYARGADLTNTLVLDGDVLLNPDLRRFPDEFVRHKILDAIGDLKLAGAALIGRFEGRRSSHTLNNRLLRALFADPANYRLEAV
jgi:UDP-3-O-[3-hydroxymyristoyl] N-acetylglucosamine deacetylase